MGRLEYLLVSIIAYAIIGTIFMAIENIYWNGSDTVYRNNGDTAPFHAEDADLEDCCCTSTGCAQCTTEPLSKTLTLSSSCSLTHTASGVSYTFTGPYTIINADKACGWQVIIPNIAVGWQARVVLYWSSAGGEWRVELEIATPSYSQWCSSQFGSSRSGCNLDGVYTYNTQSGDASTTTCNAITVTAS